MAEKERLIFVIAEFNKSLSFEQQALIYGIIGGIPHYINNLNVKEDVDFALKDSSM